MKFSWVTSNDGYNIPYCDLGPRFRALPGIANLFTLTTIDTNRSVSHHYALPSTVIDYIRFNYALSYLMRVGASKTQMAM
ncbi:hypothetical protein BOCO_0494 [Bombiscardovia coagulans]|uniref:Uncharacterized protein n=1 Tax=Bombiscardovia coagulans TaxID=686666 RepID=A0A261ESZ0_9BIFI|nr:hypothetical protein BOCO_0494 [Bombiscardovia coagulans]